MCYFPCIILYFYCYLSIDPLVGRHLCFERDKKRYRETKNDITGHIVFMSPCYRPNKGTISYKYIGYLHVYVIELYQITLSLYIYIMSQLIDSLMVAKQELVSVSAF